MSSLSLIQSSGKSTVRLGRQRNKMTLGFRLNCAYEMFVPAATRPRNKQLQATEHRRAFEAPFLNHRAGALPWSRTSATPRGKMHANGWSAAERRRLRYQLHIFQGRVEHDTPVSRAP
jgi:hypothetical protein